MIARFFALVVAICFFALMLTANAQEESPNTQSEAKAIERFETVLTRNPRIGIALDKVYEYHIQLGDLDRFLSELEKRSTSEPQNAAKLLATIGLLENQRGREQKAIEWLTKAESLAPTDAILSFYIAQSQVNSGLLSQAIASFERAIEKKPNRNDRLMIEESLGRLYLRTQQKAKAESVWARLESSYPNDTLVQERIAQANQAEGDIQAALGRYEKLASAAKDARRRTEFEAIVASLLRQLGRPNDAIAKYESLLATLNPESWRYKDLRRRIESIYLSTQDYDGWIRYLRTWLERHPDDIDSHLRLAGALNTVRKPELAQKVLVDVIAKAPSNNDLVLVLSQTFQNQKKFKEAAEQLQLLVKREPLKLDFRMLWGQMLADNPTGDKGANIKSAIAVWTDLPEALQTDAASVLLATKSIVRFGAWEPAIAMLEKACEKSPDDLSLIYELGELHLKAGHRDDAIATWNRMVAPPHDTNLDRRRLAVSFRRNGMIDQALEQIQKVVSNPEPGPGSPSSMEVVGDQMSIAQLLASKKKSEECILAVKEALKRLSPESADAFFADLRRILQSETDATAWSNFATSLSTSVEPQAWITAANIWSSLGLKSNAIQLLNSVASKMEQDAVWKTDLLARALDLYRDAQEYPKAIEICNRILENATSSRSLYLRQLSKLYLNDRQLAKAVEAARLLLELSNADSRDYGECAAICIEANHIDLAIELLKTSVRKDPAYRAGYIQLADQYSKMGRYEESISANWKSFELASGLPDQYDAIRRLAPLYSQRRRMDELIGKLRERATAQQSDRIGALWASTAYQSIRNLYQARQELEPLVHGDTLDPSLIERLAMLAEADRDFTAMITWQERLVQMEPSDANRLKLGEYLNTAGDRQRACEIYIELVRGSQNIGIRNTAMEYLYMGKHTPETIALCEELSRSEEAAWELRGIAFYLLQKNGKQDSANRIARSILEMPDPSDSGFASQIPNTIVKGNYSVFKSTSPIATDAAELNAAVAMAQMIGAKSRNRDSSSSMYWGPVSSFHQLRGAAKLCVYDSMPASERAALRSKVQEQLKSEQVTDRVLQDALIMEIAFGDKKPVANSMSEDAIYMSKEFRTIARKLLDRGHAAGARQYVQSNLADSNLQRMDPDDLELAVDVLKKGSIDANYFSTISLVLKSLQGKSRHKEVEELVEIMSNTRDGSVLNAIKNFCASRKDKELLLKFAEKHSRLLPTNQLYASAYYSPEYALLLLEGASTEKDFAVFESFLTQRLEHQVAVLESQSLTQRQGFLSLVDTPVGLNFSNGRNRTLVNEKFIDSTFYLPLELQGVLVVLSEETENIEHKNRCWDVIRSVADEPLDLKKRHRQSVYRAAATFVEHLQGNQDGRTKYLALWKEAVEFPELIELVIGGIQYREKDYQGCLRTCEQFVPTNFATQTGLTRLHLQAALKSGDIEVSRRVALSMATTRLSLTDQVKLARTLGDLQLNDKALELLGYVRYRMPASNLQEVMNAYDRLGDMATAVDIAQGLVRKSALEASWDQAQYISQPSSRAEAITYLAKHNGLAALKKEFQSQLDAAPGNETTAMQLANVCRAMGDLQTEAMLRSKFGQATQTMQTTVNSDPFGRGKSMSIADLKKILETDPKSFATLNSQSFNDYLYNDKSKQLAELVTPYLDKTGWCSIYASLVSNLESRRDPAVDDMVRTLIENYGYLAFTQGTSGAHWRYMMEKATPESRTKIAETWVAYLRDPLSRDYPAFTRLHGGAAGTFITPFLLEKLSAESTNYKTVCDEAKRLHDESSNNTMAVDILLSAAIRAKDWDQAKVLAGSFEAGGSTYKYVSFAEAISPHSELAEQAWKALEKVESSLPLTNGTFVQLYLKLAREQKHLTQLNALLDRVFERLERVPTNGMILDSGSSSGWQFEFQSAMPLLIENGRFAECWRLISLLRRQPESRILGPRDSAERFASNFEKTIAAGLTETKAVECLIEVTEKNTSAVARLARLMESDSEEFALGVPYACALEKLLQAIPSNPSEEVQSKLALLRTQLSPLSAEYFLASLSRIRIASQIGSPEQVDSLTKVLVEQVAKRPIDAQHAEAVWHVAAVLLKSERTKSAGESLLQMICPSSDQVETLVQYKVALDRGLSESNGSGAESNAWLDKVIAGFESNKIGSDQIVDVATRMAERGFVESSMKLARLMAKPKTESAAPKSPAKQNVDTTKISGLATAPVRNAPVMIRENPRPVFDEPFREERLLASKIEKLIAIWQSKGMNVESVAAVVEKFILQQDRVWMGFLMSSERVPSPVRSLSRPGQKAEWIAPKSIGLESFAKLAPLDGSLKERITDRFHSPTASLQDKLMLAMLEGAMVKSPSEHAELVQRVSPLLQDVQSSKAVSNANITFLRWTLAFQLLESKHAASIPQELIRVFLAGDYRFFSEEFSLSGKLQAAKWILKSEMPNSMETVSKLFDPIANVGDRKDCHAVLARYAIEANRPDLAMDLIDRGGKIVSRYGMFYSTCRELTPELLEIVDRLPTAKRYELLQERMLKPTELVNEELGSKILVNNCFQILRPTDTSPSWAMKSNTPCFASLPVEQAVIGLIDYLIMDAKAIGKLDDVLRKVDAQAQSESVSGPALRAWFELALRRKPTDEQITNALKKLDELNKNDLLSDYTFSTPLLYVSLFEKLVSQGHSDIAEKMMEPISKLVSKVWDRALASRYLELKSRFAASLSSNAKESSSDKTVTSDALKHWLTASFDTPGGTRFGASSLSQWTLDALDQGNSAGRKVRLLHGPLRELLILKYPLEGDFRATVDVTSNRFTTGEFSYGGLFVSSDESSTQFTFPGGRSGFYSLFPTGNSSPATSDKKKQWSMEVKNGKLRFFLDNVETTVLNAEPFSEHPFLAIQGLLSNSHTFSNLVLQKHGADGGVPVSRNVRMLGASMLGWSSDYSRSPLPDGPTDAALKTGLISSVGWQYRLPPASQDKPWKYENNTLEAIVPDKKIAPNWNCYHYQRPLDQGDTWKYEFWWEPGKSVVMPVIGRAVIHLDGERLEREWLMDSLDAHWLSIEAGKRVAITSSNRPQLKAEAWNAIELRRDGNDVSILLNGQTAGKFEIEPNQQSYPGLYVPAGVGKFSVRSMTLEGDWPSSLPSDLWECRSAW